MSGFRFPATAARALVEHDIIFELWYRMYETERSPLRRLYNRVEYGKFRRDEIEAWRRADACVVTSARETPIIHRHVPDVPVFVAPNGVDVTYFAPSNEPVDPDVIVMTGFMKTRPNIDGATHFVQAILPLILKSRPSARFYIVGGSPPDEVRALAGPNVVVTGDVPDVRPYARMAAVVVVPLRIGGGTRLKILEGLAMQKPMVSTTLGAEGIDIRHGEHLLIADDPTQFARSVLDLMEQPALGQSLAAAGREMVDRTYQWGVISDRLEEFYDGLVRSDRRRDGSRARQ
jgi:glycosyltransferase involved in cell wall biosynthesis